MTTRKILITNQYLRLCKSIDTLLDKINILPNVNDYDFIDIIYMFNIYFLDCNNDNYKEKISNLINIGNLDLTEYEMELIYEPIYEFVEWYKQLKYIIKYI